MASHRRMPAEGVFVYSYGELRRIISLGTIHVGRIYDKQIPSMYKCEKVLWGAVDEYADRAEFRT